MSPRLVIVTGRPGAGKTTLCQQLLEKAATNFQWLSRDEFKQSTLAQYQAESRAIPDNINQIATKIYWQSVIEALSIAPVLTDAAFQHPLWTTLLESLSEAVKVKVIVCDIKPALAGQRYRERALQQPSFAKVHGGLPESLIRGYQTLDTSWPTLLLDMASPVDVNKAVKFVDRDW